MKERKKIYIAVSGGKDSTATLLLALQYQREQTGMDVEVIPVFCDTKWEHPLVYQYLNYLQSKLNITITRITDERYPNGMLELIEKKKIFPSAYRRFCTDIFKRRLMMRHIAKTTTKKEVMNHEVEIWLGIRSNESESRTQKYGHLSSDDTYRYADIFPEAPIRKYLKEHIIVRLPVLHYSANDIYRYITGQGLEINPLYHQGFDRVGCFPCFIAPLAEWKRVYRDPHGKENIEKLIQLEKKLRAQGYNTRIKVNKTTSKLLSIITAKEQPKLPIFQNKSCESTSLCSFCQM